MSASLLNTSVNKYAVTHLQGLWWQNSCSFLSKHALTVPLIVIWLIWLETRFVPVVLKSCQPRYVHPSWGLSLTTVACMPLTSILKYIFLTVTIFKSDFPHQSLVTANINLSNPAGFPSRIDHFMDLANRSLNLLTWSFISSLMCDSVNYCCRHNVLIMLQPLWAAAIQIYC